MNKTFTGYLIDVLQATISGQNDLSVIGLTEQEIIRIINKDTEKSNFIYSIFFYGQDNTLIDIETAKYNLKQWENEQITIPCGLTAKEYMERWNCYVKGENY